MKLKIQDCPENIDNILYHDLNGNIILYVNNMYYLLDINNNKLIFEEISYDNLIDNIENPCYGDKIRNIIDNSLKKKILNNIEQTDNIDYDEEYEDKYMLEKNLIKHIPEYKNYYLEEIEKMEDEDYMYQDDENILFKFNSITKEPIISLLDKSLISTSYYDTTIKNGNLVVFTSTSVPYSSYIVTLYDDCSNIELNIIGDRTEIFTVKWNFNKLEIV